MSAKTTAIKRVIGTLPDMAPDIATGQRLLTDSIQRRHAEARLAPGGTGTDFAV
jgi:hypothetical protein